MHALETLPAHPAPARSTRSTRGPLLIAAAASAAGTGAVNLAVVPGHLQTSTAIGVFFLGVGAAQIVLATAILRNPSRRLTLAAAVLGLAMVAWWGLTRATGWWALTWWQPEDGTVGFTDLVHVAGQALSALLLATTAWRRPARTRGPVRATITTAALLLPVCVLTLASAGLATDGFTRAGDPPGHALRAGDPPLAPGSTTTVNYCTPAGIALNMDVYQPPAHAARPAPVAVYVYGGGLILGNRHTSGLGATLANHAGALFEPLRGALTGAGFVVVSVDYRHAPLAAWPAQIQDVKCAIRFLRAHAPQLGADPGRIGVWGASGGGQLGALLATAGPAAGFDVGQYRDQSSAVQAVVDMFGPADLDHLTGQSPVTPAIVRIAFGSSHETRRSASPITYVAPGSPPFLILHGTEDELIPASQSRQLAQRLTAAGVPVTLVLVRGAGHGLNTPAQDPSPAQLTRTVTTFLVTTLR